MSTLHCIALHTRVSEWVVFSEEERVGEHGGPGRRRRTTLGLRTHASSDQLALPPGLDHILSRVCIIHASCFFCLSTATTNHYSLISRHQCPHTYCTLLPFFPLLSSGLLLVLFGLSVHHQSWWWFKSLACIHPCHAHACIDSFLASVVVTQLTASTLALPACLQILRITDSQIDIYTIGIS